MPVRKVTISTTAPANPNTGDGWIHSTTRVEKIWDDSTWVPVAKLSDLVIDANKDWGGKSISNMTQISVG